MLASLRMQQPSSSLFCSVIGAKINVGDFVVAKRPEAEGENEESVFQAMGADSIQRQLQLVWWHNCTEFHVNERTSVPPVNASLYSFAAEVEEVFKTSFVCWVHETDVINIAFFFTSLQCQHSILILLGADMCSSIHIVVLSRSAFA